MNKPQYSLYTIDYPPARGGVAMYLFGLAGASEGGILVHADAGRWFWRLWPKWLPLLWRFWQERSSGTDLLLSHVFPLGTAAWLSRLAGGPEYVLIFHGLDLRNVRTGWKRFLLKQICKRAKTLVVNSESTKRDLLARIGEGEWDIRVLYPALSTAFLNTSSSLAAKQLPRGTSGGRRASVLLRSEDASQSASLRSGDVFSQNSNERAVVLSVARLVPRKGIDVAIRAMKGVDAEYVVLGDGEDRGRLERIAREEDVNVRFLGAVSDEEKEEWLRRADLFLLPVRDEGDDVEGFGIVFLEAAAHSVPVIAGRSGGAVEAVDDKKTGILVDPKSVEEVRSAIVGLLNDAKRRKEMGEAGREWVKRFSWEGNWRMLAPSHVTPRTPLGATRSVSVSVVIPCYNHASILRRTLRGLLCQTRPVDEIVVVDDGSVDNPKVVVEEFADWLPIRYIRLDKNSGAPIARNRGADETTGDLILFLDADAELYPQAIEKMEKELRTRPDVDFVFSDFLWGRKAFHGMRFSEGELKKRNYIHTSSLLRRNAFPGFDPSLTKLQDWDLWLTMADQGSKGAWIHEILYRIEPRREGGMSRWIPRFVYQLPWNMVGWIPAEVKKYQMAEDVVRKKHGI